jgi:hypothetical protein
MSRRIALLAVEYAGPEAVLEELTNQALALQEIKPVLDPETIQDEIRKRVRKQAREILGDVETDYADYENTRKLAERGYRRRDYPAWGIFGIALGYILSTALLSRPRPVYGLTATVVAVLAGMLVVRLRAVRRERRRLLRELAAARERWKAGLRDRALLPFILQTLDELTEPSAVYATCLDPGMPPRLVERSEPRRLVATDAMNRIGATAESMREGSLGVSGPRGAGKTTIVRYFCDDAYHVANEITVPDGDASGAVSPLGEPELRVMLSAPVDYQPHDFMLHLFIRLAETVLESVPARGPADRRITTWPGWLAHLPGARDWRGLAPASSADCKASMEDKSRRLLAGLRYQRTYSTSWNASLTPTSVFGLAGAHGRQLTEQPVTLPELVARYREYSEDVAAWWRSYHGGQGRVLIGIDEVDKIPTGERAETFLNDVKAVFGVPGCLYLVSVSEDALAAFARRAHSIRSVLDSAFDELASVPPMTYRNSRDLLIKRVAGLPHPFIALCHVLAGGLPRDLVRAARGLINAARSGKETTLVELAGALVGRELDSLRQASLGRLAACPDVGNMLGSLYEQSWPGGTEPRRLLAAAAGLAPAAGRARDDQVRQVCMELIVSLSFHATVLTVFGPLQDHLVNQLREDRCGLVDEEDQYSLIDGLAKARQAMRLDTSLAHALIERYLHENGIAL